MKRKEASIRKVRSDKKRDLKPTVGINLYNCISDLAYVVNIPIKDVVEFICVEGIVSRIVIEHLSVNFKRDYLFESTQFIGNNSLQKTRYIIGRDANKQRISTRVTQEFYEHLAVLAHALDYTPSSASHILLETSVKDMSIIDKLVKTYTSNLNDNKRKVLKDVVRYLRINNPFIEAIGFMDIVRYLLSK